jgi:hypothetical protein
VTAETVVFTSRRVARMQRVQAARHVLVGLLLASSGYDAITSGHHASWLDVVAIVAGLLLLVAFVLEMRRARSATPHHGHGVGWVDIFAAAVTLVEAGHLFHRGKVRLPFAYLLVALLLLVMGLMHGRLQRLRRLVVDDRGFDIRTSPWSRTQLAWSEVAELRRDGDVVTAVTTTGREHRVDLRDMDHGDEAIETLLARAAAALASTSPPAPALATALASDEPFTPQP